MNTDIRRLKADYELGNQEAGGELAVEARRRNDSSLMREVFSRALAKGYLDIIDSLMKSMSDADLVEVYDAYVFPSYKRTTGVDITVTYSVGGEEFSEQGFRERYQHRTVCRYFEIACEAIRRRIERWKRKQNGFGQLRRFLHNVDTDGLIDQCLDNFGFKHRTSEIRLAPCSLNVVLRGEFTLSWSGSVETLCSDWFLPRLEEAHEKFENERVNFLLSRSTRELLEYLDCARKYGGWYSPVDASSPWGWAYEEIKDVLSTREHLPNKEERKAMQRQKAKAGRQRGRKDR